MTFVTLWTSTRPTGAAANPRPANGQPAIGEPATGQPATGASDGGAAGPDAALAALLTRLPAVSPHAVVAPYDDATDGGTLVWVDGRGLPARATARAVLRLAREAGLARPRVGVARVAVAAAVAARWGACRGGNGGGAATALTGVAPGAERAFLAAHPLAVLLPSTGGAGGRADAAPRAAAAHAAAALGDLGVVACGELAGLTQEAVEVRFGAAGVALWRLARADDGRRVFRHAARERPSASLEWNEFALRDPQQLFFFVARLAGQVCDALRARGEAAGGLTVAFALAGGARVERRVRAARDTADAATWRRLLRAGLAEAVLPDAVCGVALRAETTRVAAAPQGDLFDRGARTAAAAVDAVARLVEDEAGRPVGPDLSGHALPEHRMAWRPLTAQAAVDAASRAPCAIPASGAPAAATAGPARRRPGTSTPPRRLAPAGGGVARPGTRVTPNAPPGAPAALSLRVLSRARRLATVTRRERGHDVPVRYCERPPDGARAARGLPPVEVFVEVLGAAGPDRVAGGAERGAPASREYWQCLTDRGELVLLFRALAPTSTPADGGAGSGVGVPGGAADDAAGADDAWFLHGWWD